MSDRAPRHSFYVSSPSVRLRKIHPEQAHLIDKVIRKILSLKVTKETIAQIIDNMPIKGNFVGEEITWMVAHPAIEKRSQPSEEATRLASKFCAAIDPMSLDIDLRAGEGFQKEAQKDPQSAASARRCLEIVSSVLHDITSKVYGKNHPPPNEVEKRKITPGCTESRHTIKCCPIYGRLRCTQSTSYSSFKHSSSSTVGYWAECMIFGGPILFARGRAGTEVRSFANFISPTLFGGEVKPALRANDDQCSAAFIHLPSSEIIELTDAQVKSILSLADSGPEQSNGTDNDESVVIPFTPSGEARHLSIADAIMGRIYREKGQLDGQQSYNPKPRLRAGERRYLHCINYHLHEENGS